MKYLTLLIFAITTYACTSSNEINGRSFKTANRSVNTMKNRLQPDQRIEFEVSYWIVRDAMRNNAEFLDTVDGKNAEEMIALGRANFIKRKQSGFQAYEKYASWEQMIAKFTQDRNNQDRRHKKTNKADKDNDVLYNL